MLKSGRKDDSTMTSGYCGRKVICIHGPFPSKPKGGIATQTLTLCKKLEDSGFSVIRAHQRRYVFLPFDMFKLASRFQKSDVIHTQSASYDAFGHTIIASILSKITGKPIVISYFGGKADDFLSAWAFVVKPFVGGVKLGVTSSYLQEIFEKHGIEVNILPQILDFESFQRSPRDVFEPNLLWVRHLEPIYNPLMALRAFSEIKKKIPGARLTMIGEGILRKEVEGYIEEKQLRDVTLEGRITFERLKHYYDNSDIFMNTSNYDNLPVTLLEAASNGLLLVSTNAGGIPHVFKDGYDSMLVDVDEHEEMARRVVLALQDQNEMKRLVFNSKETSKKFSWKSVEPIFIELYCSMEK